MNVRPAAVAGSFYPAEPASLRRDLQTLLSTAKSPIDATAKPATPPLPRALIVPHAGYRYSGTVAAAAYACLQPDAFRRVLLLGPAHRVWLRGIALPTVDAFETPLGRIPLAHQLWPVLEQFPFVLRNDEAHADEHALEVQLPFLQATLGHFELIPLVVGECPPAEVAAVIAAVADASTLIVISTDLSHFHPYEDAQQIDAQTIAQIAAVMPTLAPEQACGAMPLNGLLHFLSQSQLSQNQFSQNQFSHAQASAPGKPLLLAHDNSGDHGGPRQRVVGYASFRLD